MKMFVKKYCTLNVLKVLYCFASILLLSACDFDNGGDENYTHHAECWQASFIKMIKANTLYDEAANKVIAGGLSAVIALGFAIWMAWYLLKILASFKEENLGETLSEIFQKLAICAFCICAVTNKGAMDWVLDTFVMSIYRAFMDLTTDILGLGHLKADINLGVFGRISFDVRYNVCTMPTGNPLDTIYDDLGCVACRLSERLNSGMKIAVAMMGAGLGGILVGIVVLLSFLVAKFGFVLYFVDSLFILCFAAVLYPLLIAAIPFKQTRKWSKQVFLMFLNSSGIIMFMTLLSCLVLATMENILPTLNYDQGNAESEVTGDMILSMLFVAILIFNVPGLGVALADKLIGGGKSSGFANNISKFVMTMAKKAAFFALGKVTYGAGDKIGEILDKYEVTREVKDKLKVAKNNVSAKLDELAGYNDD